VAAWDGSINVVSAANGLRVDVARAETTPDYWHRNVRSDEVIFIHTGQVTYRTELGSVTGEPGDFILVPRGVSHKVSANAAAVYFVLEYPAAPVLWTDGAMGVFVAATRPAPATASATA
jgi:homogentisate 1,2-dioxygenase